jgi:hypothetical protein
VLYDSAEKEGRATCESDWKDGKPSNEELPPPLLNEDDEVVKLVLVCPSGLLPNFCCQLLESMIAIRSMTPGVVRVQVRIEPWAWQSL